MKKNICATLFVLAVGVLSGCGNQQFLDTTYTFNNAMLLKPDGGIIEGRVQSWRDFADGDSVQVVIDGKTYYTHISNVLLISE